MSIRSLQFTNAGPFGDIEFQFDEHVNVFAGPNNSGKTTALLVLSDIAVYPFSFPDKLLRSDEPQFRMRFDAGGKSVKSLKGQLPISDENKYWTDERFANHRKALKLLGCTTFVPTLRWSTDYRSDGPVSGRKKRDESRFPELLGRLDVRRVLPSGMTDRNRESGPNASIVRDAEVIQDMIELDYMAYREENLSIRQYVSNIGAITSEITEGFPIEFLGFEEDEGGLCPHFRTPDGNMPLNVLSQGTQSLIQWIGRLVIEYGKFYDYPKSLVDKPGVLIIDEMDAHLHPSWQRRILPTLQHHFPALQVFCATHSPLMLAGLKAGQVQLLRRDDNGGVSVTRNETDIQGWSADEILRGLLDVPNATDLKTDSMVQRLAELRRKENLSGQEAKELKRLRTDVSRVLRSGPAAGDVETHTKGHGRAAAKKTGKDTAATKATRRRKARPSAKARRRPG